MSSIERDIEDVLGPQPEPAAANVRPLVLVQAERPKAPQEIEFERCRQWLEPALEGGRRTMAEVIQALVSGQAQLWPGKACAMITEVHQFPTAKVLQVWLAGGDGAELMAMQAGVEAWARLVGCSEVLIEGRQGWARKLKPIGFELYCVCLRKAL